MSDTPIKIIAISSRQHHFWQDLQSWAPEEVQDLLKGARLDWGLQLAKKLNDFYEHEKQNDIELILAWTTLGALLEQTLKLFLCVFYLDYQKDPVTNKKGSISPRKLSLEKIRQYLTKNSILHEDQLGIIESIQLKRNAIHTFDGREIGTIEDFYSAVNEFYKLQLEIELRLPYPD